MGTAIVRSNGAMERFGDIATMQTLMQRGAAIFQVPQDDLGRPEVQGALMKAMQWTITYGAMPGRHIHLIPSNKKDGNNWIKVYAVADSFEWRKLSADQKAQQMGWRYMLQTEQLDDDEVKRYTTANNLGGVYEAVDRGFRSRVLFQHEIAMSKEMGFTYNPPWHYGFWRKNSYLSGDKWKPDNVPTGRTPDWVAMKRAEKSALAQHFELQPVANWEQMNERQRQARIEDGLNAIEPLPERVHEDAMFYEAARVDEDGVYVVDATPARKERKPIATVEVEPAKTQQEPPAERKPSDIIADKTLGQPIIDFVVELRGKESPGAKIASKAQYEYVVGVLEAITGKDTHTELLACLFARPVSSDSPISEAAAKHIFKCLGTKASRKDESGQWVKYDNPDYDAGKVEFISLIWKWYLGTEEATDKVFA